MRTKMKVKLDKNAIMPTRAHDDDAGLDVMTPIDMFVPAHSFVFIDTGVHVEAPKGTDVHIRSKSGLNRKHGLTADGTIDRGYTGTVGVTVHNDSDNPYQFYRGDKIAQLVVEYICIPELELIDDERDMYGIGLRGSDGYGSSGR